MNVRDHIAVQSAEGRLLLRLCRPGDKQPTAQDLAGVSGESLVKLAGRHRLLPMLYSGVKRLADPQSIGPEALTILRNYIQGNAGLVLRLAGELRRLMSEFDRVAIPVIPFKGLVLSAQVYGDLSMREAGDLDLLVKKDDIVRAADLLVSLGHHPIFPTATPCETAYLKGLKGERRGRYLRWHCEHHLVYEPTNLNVDLHWAMSLREFSVSLDVEGIWKRTKRSNIAGREVLTLSNEDLLIVLCLNGAKDCWERLDRVCDVARLLSNSAETLNWQLVFDHATEAGVARMLRVGLRLASGLLGAPLPSLANCFIEQDAEVEPVASSVVATLFTSQPVTASRAARSAFDLRLRERWGDRVHYCLAQFRPGVGDWAAVPLPDSLSFLHYAIRPFRLAMRHLRPTHE